MGEVTYGRYEEAFRAIHSALSGIMAGLSGKKITKLAFTWIEGGTAPETIKVYDGDELLFTLTFTWNVDGTLNQVARS